MKTIFFTVCSRDFQNERQNSHKLDYVGFMNSFKKFHPDIEMRVFDERDLQKHGLNVLNAKAAFGQILSKDYDLVVNVDADHYFFDRLEEILAADYDIAAPANFNEANNVVGIKVTSGLHGEANKNWLIDEVDFLQGGLIASPNPQFWGHYAYAAEKHYQKFHCAENDVLNLVAYLYPYKIKVLDGHLDYRNAAHKMFYGCSIIGKEHRAYMEGDKIMIEGKQVKAYHFAHGSAKRVYSDIFPTDVSEFIKQNIIS